MKLKIVLIFFALIISTSLLFVIFKRSNPKALAENLLGQADIKINGDRPWDVRVHNEKLYERVMREGSLGLGESYMDGWWDCPALDEFFFRLMNAQVDKKVTLNWSDLLDLIKSKLINMQTKERSLKVGQEHYDLGNDLFACMLDKHMIYSCAYWNNEVKNIDDAQEQKLDLICKKLNLKPGMTLLDIGCGWGGLARHAAQQYGAHVTGITISNEQADFGQQSCKDLPVKIILKDYRDLDEKFDRIVSVGMFEHVGYKNYKEFMNIADRCLKDDGLFLLHTIGTNNSVTSSDPWLSKYIFPNSMLPSIRQISEAIEGLFVMEDWHNFSAHYDKTLMAWYDRFQQSWNKLESAYGDRFYRMWNYYLLSCAGSFRARSIQLWQIVLSKHGVIGGYNSIR